MKLFKEGTLVVVSSMYHEGSLHGKVGKVLEGGERFPYIAFKDHVGGHSCGGLCEHGYGWAVPSQYLREVNIQLENK